MQQAARHTSSPTVSSRLANWLAALIVVATGTFYLATLRPGHAWNGDFSLYVAHARNIVEGTRYADTGYVFNPARPDLSPRWYPPVFPLLLAPVYALFGLNLMAMKVEAVLLFAAFSWLAYLVLREHLPPPFALATLAAIGFNSYLWEAKDNVESEIPFLLFTFLTLWLWQRAGERAEGHGWRRWVSPALAGVAAYLAYGTRSIGLLLPPVLLLDDLVRRRRFTLSAGVTLGSFCALALLQGLLMPSDSGYLTTLATFASPILPKARWYLTALEVPLNRVPWLATLTSGLALLGLAARLRAQISVWQVFSFAYIAALLAWPVTSARFIVPLLPFYLFHAFAGLHHLTRWLARARIRFAPSVPAWPVEGFVLLAVLLSMGQSYVRDYLSVGFGPIPGPTTEADGRALLAYVREETPDSAIVVFRKPRVLALYTGRDSAVYHQPVDERELWRFMRDTGATFLVDGTLDAPYLHRFVRDYPDHLREVYANDSFSVYGIDYPCPPGLSRADLTASNFEPVNWEVGDTLSLVGYRVEDAPSAEGAPGLRLTLAWQASAQPTEEYTVFVHLQNEQGRTLAQHDTPPCDGLLPTHWWTPGEIYTSQHLVTLPDDAGQGPYQFLAGMYTWPDLERLPVTDGSLTPDERAILLAP